MNNSERQVIDKMLLKGLYLDAKQRQDLKQDLVDEIGINISENPKYVFNLFCKAVEEKNNDDLDRVLGVLKYFNLYNESYANIFKVILAKEWHKKHEDIVELFKKYKWSQGVDAIYETALKEFNYMEYDEFSSLAVRCIWALKYIGTKEAKEKLYLLSQSNNEIISKNAKERLESL